MTISENKREHNISDGKPQELAIAISILLVLAICFISLNFWSASESSHDAFAINLSGKQRMLTQSIEKNLLKLKVAKKNHTEKLQTLHELSQNYQRFDNALMMLAEGRLFDKNNDAFTVNFSKSKHASDLINEAKLIWEPMKAALLPVLSSTPELSGLSQERALFIISRDNQHLLRLMDSLTSEIENASHARSEKIRLIQASAIGLILINFGFVVFYFRRQIKQLSESKLLSTLILENVGTAIVVMNAECVIELCNHAAENMFGFSARTLTGTNLTALLEKPYFLQIGKKRNGIIVPLEIELSEIHISGRTLFITSLYDKTEQRHKEEQLIQLAYHDPLTKLPNRIVFMDRLVQTIARAHRNNEMAAVLFIDLDRFKQVNDSLGHAIGDLLLQEVASRLSGCLREGDTLARLGGDEFTMSIEANDIDICLVITKRVLSELNREFLLNGHSVHISASIGASFYPQSSSDIHQLLHFADIAMYQAKAMGGNTCCKYPTITSDAEPLQA